MSIMKCIADWFSGDSDATGVESYNKVLLEAETLNAELFAHSLYKGMKAHKIIVKRSGCWVRVTLKLHKTILLTLDFIVGEINGINVNYKAISKKDGLLLADIITPIIEPYIK